MDDVDTSLEERMGVLYVMAGIDRAIERGWMGGEPFATKAGHHVIEAWLTANEPPTDNQILSVLACMIQDGKINLGGGGLGGQKAKKIKDFMTLIKLAWADSIASG